MEPLKINFIYFERGYDKNEFLKDCNYITGGKRFNVQMIKNGLRWYKLLDENAPDIEYFELEPEDRMFKTL